MALLATPLAAPDEEPWLRGAARSGLRFHLLTAADGAGGLEAGLEDLLRVFGAPRSVWVAQLSGSVAGVAYALDVLGGGAPAGDGHAATVVLGGGVARAATALVDAPAGSGLYVVVLNVSGDRVEEVVAAFVRGDLAAGLLAARVAVLRQGGAAWAVAATSAGAVNLLARAAALDRAGAARLPVRPGAGGSSGIWSRWRWMPLPDAGWSTARRERWREAGSRLPVPTWLSAPASRWLRSFGGWVPRRLGAAAGAVLVCVAAAAGAGWEVLHHGQSRLVPVLQRAGPPSPEPPAPPPRTGAMTATWDRAAQVILFGGAIPNGAGHGTPLADTWRGAVPPAGAWQRLQPDVQPSARLAGAMAADVTDGYALLFGGEAAGDVGLRDTWTYSGGWAPVEARSAPPAGPAVAATEPSTGRVLLVTACCALAAIPTGERMQTWRWTGSDWVLLGPSPGWVTTAAMVADPWDDSVVMVADGGDGRAATFVWDGATWHAAALGAVEPPATPGVRPALTYDAVTHTVVEVAPAPDGRGHVTWTWDGRAWTEHPGAGGPPTVGLLLPEPVDGHALLYGGSSPDNELTQRWFWTDGAWHELLTMPAEPAEPAAGFGSALAADPGTGGLVLFGGSDAAEQTWLWNGSAWGRRFSIDPSPGPRLAASMAYDPASGVAILVGGRLADGQLARDMWRWRSDGWSQVSVAPLPPASLAAPMAWDTARHQAVLVVPDAAAGGLPPTAQTWTWDGVSWSRRSPPVSPPLRAGSSMAFDPATGDVLLVVPCCPGGVEQRSDTWTWDGATWTLRQTLHAPPILAAVAADVAGRRTLLVAACCGGFSDTGTVGPPQTWSWDGRDWTRLGGAVLPAMQDVVAVVGDARGSVLLVGRVAGAGPRHPLDGLWRWTGSGWERLL